MAFIDELRKLVDSTRAAYEQAQQRAQAAALEAEMLGHDLRAAERTLEALLRRDGKAPAAASVSQAQPLLAPDLRTNGRINKTDLAQEIIAAGGPMGVGLDDLDAGFQARGIALQRNYLFNITSRLKHQSRIEQRGKRYFVKAA